MATLPLPAGFVEQRTGNTLWWVKADWAPVLRDAVVRSSHDLTSWTPDAGRRTPQLLSAEVEAQSSVSWWTHKERSSSAPIVEEVSSVTLFTTSTGIVRYARLLNCAA